MQEIESHQRTDDALQKARAASPIRPTRPKAATSRAISHELRTPLNSILGYAQILDADENMPPHRKQAVSVIRKSGDHLLSVIEGTLDIARIEGGKLTLDVRALDFPDFMQQIVGMFELQARNKGLSFDYQPAGEMPAVVRADEKRLRQILINVLGNAVKFTVRGGVSFSVECRREMAVFEIGDTGPGIPRRRPGAHLRTLRPRQQRAGRRQRRRPDHRPHADRPDGRRNAGFAARRAKARCSASACSCPRCIRRRRARELPRLNRIGYVGVRRRILVVDNEKVDRDMLQNVLEPLGFIVEQAASGYECLRPCRASRRT